MNAGSGGGGRAGGGEGRGEGRCKQHYKHMILCLLQLVRGFVSSKYNVITKKQSKVNKPPLRMSAWEKLQEVPLSKSRQIYEYML